MREPVSSTFKASLCLDREGLLKQVKSFTNAASSNMLGGDCLLYLIESFGGSCRNPDIIIRLQICWMMSVCWNH